MPDHHVCGRSRACFGFAIPVGGYLRAFALVILTVGACQPGSAQMYYVSPDLPTGSGFVEEGDRETWADWAELSRIEAAPSGIKVVGAGSGNRIFGILPNFRAEQSQRNYKPLTTREKYRLAHSDSFDWPNYSLLAGYAVQSQVASQGFRHNGGLSGFSKFYARSVADQIIGSYITEAILPGVLHEDPRFFRRGAGSFLGRASYAASRVFITHRDNGSAGLNISELAGNSGVVAITCLYYPNSRSASEGLERFGIQLGNDMISNLLTEFWPDVKRHLLPHRGSVDRSYRR